MIKILKKISKINENNESLLELKNSIEYIESIDDEGILWKWSLNRFNPRFDSASYRCVDTN